ncbi:MAG: exopolysaccharide biosynthesis protein [Phenylobacterium sp.]
MSPAPKSDPRQPLSGILRDIAEQPGPDVSVGELAERFGARATGALLMVFGLVCILPLPPGSTTVFGAPLVLLAPQVAVRASAPWLPARLKARTLSVADLRRALPRALKWLERFEAVSRPRLTFLFGAWGQRAIGVVCTVLALVLIMPIPLGNMLPAASVTVLSFSLVQRDGALALLGYVLAGCSAGVLVVAAGLIVRAAEPILRFLDLA